MIAVDTSVAVKWFKPGECIETEALDLGAEFFVVDDHHFLAPEVVNYAARSGVRIVNLPDLIAALDTSPTNGNEATIQNP